MPELSVGPIPPTCLITGGAGALGFAIAQKLAAGRRIAIIDIGEETQERAASLPDAIGIACDVSDEAALRVAWRRIDDWLGGPAGVVVHAAGVAPVVPFLDVSMDTFDEALNVNLRSAFVVYQLAARRLVAAGAAGRFISIASISGARAGYGRTAYGTSKAALIHMASQMALELGPYGITTNTVAPAPVDTPLSREANSAEAVAEYVRSIPMARYGREAEVADAVAFLASTEAGFISGQTLFVDGGYMAAGMGVTMAQSAAVIRKADVATAVAADPAPGADD